ncbi:CinA family protein [Desulfurispora thermophila]|uniref:CinA family protein n=1 Tax=Desulfurispora thermophila TaxID=265470 RepID=UPI0003618B72|nr:nicotinamide-nucleotide amidohydrolase family protein [Desulfurispora thermophila]
MREELLAELQSIQDAMCRLSLTLAVAESCTGGLLAGLITSLSGSSQYFRGGVVAYHNQVKADLLGVPEQDIVSYGAVSPQVAVAMAGGVQKRLAATVGIGITGIAGPGGGSREKPVGTVYIALKTTQDTLCRLYNFSGDREQVRHQAVAAALDMLKAYLTEKGLLSAAPAPV